MAKDKTVYDLPKMTAESIQRAFEERVDARIRRIQLNHPDSTLFSGWVGGLEEAKIFLSELVKRVD